MTKEIRRETRGLLPELQDILHESPDPHIWVSLKNTRVMINHMYDALAGADPAYAPYYQANRDTVLANITLMDNEITQYA